MRDILTYYIDKLHKDIDNKYKVKAILIGMKNEKEEKHAVAAFPCRDDFTICNSGIEPSACFTTVEEFLRYNYRNDNYNSLRRFTLIGSRY